MLLEKRLVKQKFIMEFRLAGERKTINGVLERIHVTREEVYITSAVRSRPYKWREKKNEMVKSYKKV